jgi:transposase InsO family protein
MAGCDTLRHVSVEPGAQSLEMQISVEASELLLDHEHAVGAPAPCQRPGLSRQRMVVARARAGLRDAFRHARDEARRAVFKWLIWYNRERLHRSIAYMSPMEFEEFWDNQEAA